MRMSKKRLPIRENNEMKPCRRPMRKPGGLCTFGTVCVAHEASDRPNAKSRRTASPRHLMCASGIASGVPISVDDQNNPHTKHADHLTTAKHLIGKKNVNDLQPLWRNV